MVDPSLINQPVTFTATVSPPTGATDTPTGTVQFQVDGVNQGLPVTLDGSGQATIALATLSGGAHTIAVEFPNRARLPLTGRTARVRVVVNR